MNPGKLYLIGPMGAGKTTIGRVLAQQLGLTFLDSDHEIEARTGVSIPTIFEYEGENGFREREEKVIDELTLRDGLILATGGGVVKNPANRQHLSSRGLVIYLQVSIEEQLARTARDKNRPLLQTENPKATLEKLARERAPLYAEIADYSFDTDNKTAKQVVKEILAVIEADRENA